MAIMARVICEFGLDHLTIMQAPGPNDMAIAPLVLESTLPGQFAREFDKNHFLRYCPILPKFNNSVLPQSWSLDGEGPSPNFDCPEKMYELMQRYGLLMGLIFPVTSIDASRYFLRYDGKRSPLHQAELNELGMISLHAFDVFDRMRRAETTAPNLLSARELEVLRWTAQGKTSIEIGQILSLSDHTINAYMTNAIKKLDCVNRTQLVAKAIRLKLIN
ncbi:LuxR family transcriptional regulator [Ciceribacter naphthalenivorans]|uniref:LuxR family transcriptional regulator n=3 Tax=Pseudomonadota TaxID=1224 RepID=A0A512HEX4_9HYPH|nr:LuxR family transcriptional regulator [Ciceribacter naphthalenivorans]GLR21121.1 LuxR family transcriptional regulator [Ciceribacter naphthalenivorans]GLT03977.1 LuxR family transcriptional regulator [Sphingomonas psychrolutea]